MLLNILLALDFLLLALVISAYIRHTLADRRSLAGVTEQSLELQQKIYQIQVLQEIGERIGYSLDTNKIVEIITSSLGNLLEYDTVSYMVFLSEDQVLFKCHVHNSVSRRFISQVKQVMLESFSAIFQEEVAPGKIDESITGNILDDNLQSDLKSFFNLPVIISGRLVGIINIASKDLGKFGAERAEFLYAITNQAATAVSKLEEVLESEKGKLSAIIYSLTDGVLTVNLEHQLLVYNPAVKEILQLPKEKPVTMFDIVDALAGKMDLRTKIEQALVQDQPVVVKEVILPDKALEITVTPVKDNEGKKLAASVVLRDVTTEKSLEKLRQEFTAMMVHELRAPLTAVRWSSDSLMKSASAASVVLDPQKVKESVSAIATAATNMLDLVNDLLDVAKVEAGKFELNVQDYDLVEVIKAQAKTFEPLAQTKHLALNVIAPAKYTMKFDRVRIAQVLNNLISNAIKYTDSGQIDIDLSVNAQAKEAVVAIKDTGLGVAREDLGQLFSKFRQLQNVDRSRKGTGLGLVVSKGIVEAHKGRIWGESAGENLGSTFYFSLPF